MPLISIVVPVYKAENSLPELYRRLRDTLEPISSDFEIILIEDCGGDRSWEVITELGRQDQRVVGLQFSRNFGQHYGITAGMDYAQGDWVVIMDCDLQDSPEEIPRLYDKAQEGYDVVLASRQNRKHHMLKRLTSGLFYWTLNSLSGLSYDGSVGNYRMVSRKVADQFRHMREHLRFFGGMIDWMGFRTATIEVEHSERHDGKSTYTWRKLFTLASETIIAYSEKPLRISVTLGFIIAFFAFLFGGYLMFRALMFGTAVSGWSSLIVSMYFLGGIIIANLGIIGVYLGKTFNEARNRPLYIISERINA